MLIGSVQQETEQSQMKVHLTIATLIVQTFTAWMNYHLQKEGLKVEHLGEDIKTGVVLAKFLGLLIGEEVKRIRPNPKLRIQVCDQDDIIHSCR